MEEKILNNDINVRTKALLGDDFNKISNSYFVVCGVGGVGSIIPISLVRSGCKKIKIIDFDKVDYSNLNRQLAYDLLDVGKIKVEVLKNKLLQINPECEVILINKRIGPDFDFHELDGAEYVFDCIDNLEGKVLIAKYCLQNNINVISSMGMGNRIDPSKLEITKLNKTHDDPLARKFRFLLKQENLDLSKFEVCFSTEYPIIKNKVVSSIIYVPNSAGLLMVSYVIKKMLEE